ncbi:HWE histidine kinase domain-containing protein [Novosphingobium pokkalii]|uniref:HWE histidine kinase domain-containing protein n=1 Tax=Novosphingobium pokkalii TaxID=1770194 RepID=UPI0036251F3F
MGRLERTERARLDAASQSAAMAEARVMPSLGLLAVIIAIALILGLWQVIRTAQAQAAAANAALIAEARDRADLLARELNHRVKNLFAVILAIVKMSARGDTAAAPAVDRIAKRIHALVTAHDVTQGRLDGEGEVDLADLVAKAIAPYRSDSERCNLAGGSLVVSGGTRSRLAWCCTSWSPTRSNMAPGLRRAACWTCAGATRPAATAARPCAWCGRNAPPRPGPARRRRADARRLWLGADPQFRTATGRADRAAVFPEGIMVEIAFPHA